MTDFWTLLQQVQEYISRNYSAALADSNKLDQVRAYIEQYLREHGVEDIHATTEAIFQEMCLYSILTPYLCNPDYEEINVNGWDDVAITHLDGSIHKLDEHFHSPKHAVDIIRRLLHHSGMIIDDAMPMAQGHLPGNTRITVLKAPVVDRDRGVSVSIRMLHPSRITPRNLIETGFATPEMVGFLCMCVRYGVPFVIAGATSSGKTSLLNAILSTVPNSKRIFSIESGARELSLVRRSADGAVVNNVVHTLSRPSDNPAYDISQENLVVASLRFNPDVVVVGEMRDTEAYSAVEASLTGHTVVSTVHAGPGAAAHMRIALLCQKRFPIDFGTSLIQAAQAFPLVVFTHKLENNDRKIMDISECVISAAGEREYRCLYDYRITKNTEENGKLVIDGCFGKPNPLSDSLRNRLIQNGVPQEELKIFTKEGMNL